MPIAQRVASKTIKWAYGLYTVADLKHDLLAHLGDYAELEGAELEKAFTRLAERILCHIDPMGMGRSRVTQCQREWVSIGDSVRYSALHPYRLQEYKPCDWCGICHTRESDYCSGVCAKQWRDAMEYAADVRSILARLKAGSATSKELKAISKSMVLCLNIIHRMGYTVEMVRWKDTQRYSLVGEV